MNIRGCVAVGTGSTNFSRVSFGKDVDKAFAVQHMRAWIVDPTPLAALAATGWWILVLGSKETLCADYLANPESADGVLVTMGSGGTGVGLNINCMAEISLPGDVMFKGDSLYVGLINETGAMITVMFELSGKMVVPTETQRALLEFNPLHM